MTDLSCRGRHPKEIAQVPVVPAVTDVVGEGVPAGVKEIVVEVVGATVAKEILRLLEEEEVPMREECRQA